MRRRWRQLTGHCFGCAVYSKVTPLGKLSGEEAFLPLAPFVMDI